MTQTLYQKAIRFAGEKHYMQSMPGSKANYLVHISNVAMEVLLAYQHNDNFDLNYALPMAILHDTLEDTTTTYEELKDQFGERVALGVKALTKDKNIKSKSERMNDSLERILVMDNEVGIVKLADRITNMQIPPQHWSLQKRLDYLREAENIAKILAGKNDYLYQRLQKKLEEYGNYINSSSQIK